MRAEALSDSAMKVLRVLRESATDGYTVMSRARLSQNQLADAISELSRSSLLEIKGDEDGPEIGEAYLYLPPGVKGYVDLIIREKSLLMK
jgi:hypothetical protein